MQNFFSSSISSVLPLCVILVAGVLNGCTTNSQDDGEASSISIGTEESAGEQSNAQPDEPDSESASATGEVTGAVTDAAGEPVPMVALEIRDLQLGAMTGPAGEYSVRNVPPGEHVLRAAYPGGETEVTIEVFPDSVVKRDIQFEE